MSKRHGATSVQAFRDMGVVPDAMVNYLARLGWSHGDQEIFSRAELIALFDIKNVGASGAVFDQTKLEWLSQEYMKRMPDRQLAEMAAPFFEKAGFDVPKDPVWLAKVVGSLKERAKTLTGLVDVGRFYFKGPEGFETEDGYEHPAAHRYLLTPEAPERLSLLIQRLQELGEFNPGSIEAVYRDLTTALGVKLVDLAQLTRLAVTGKTASPPLFDLLAILGREETLARLRKARRCAGPASR